MIRKKSWSENNFGPNKKLGGDKFWWEPFWSEKIALEVNLVGQILCLGIFSLETSVNQNKFDLKEKNCDKVFWSEKLFGL